MSGHILDEAMRSEILGICKEVACPYDIVAVSFHDSHVRGLVEKKAEVNTMLILDSPRLTLKFHLRPLEERTVSLLAVDQKTFERDVNGDWLGGLLVENMLIPYEPLVNGDYLWSQEVKGKKRIIVEILGNLVLEYPEMSHELLIKPEYFMFESMARKASLYPPMVYRFLDVFRSAPRERNQKLVMEGFEAALDSVAKEGYVVLSGGYVKITRKFIEGIERKKLRVLNLLKNVRSSILRHSFEVFPKMMRSLIEDYWTFTRRFVNGKSLEEIHLPELEDPRRCIFIPTSLGLVSLSDKVTIEDFVKRTVPNGRSLEADMEKLGGALNAVYRIRLSREGEEQDITVKVFKDWYGWKWFPLALWALGTRGFAVLGKSRLEKEYAINMFLSSRGLNVARVIYASPKERLIFQEHIEGENVAKIVKQICSSREERSDLTRIVRQVGSEIAKVHKLGVALGDCKPENIIVARDGRIYFVDLEQAERGGDQAWDVAELLYFSGHYASLSSIETAQVITREFVEGYLEAGGETENVRKARSPRYVKVFSFFTPPHIIFAISSTCREILRGKRREKEKVTRLILRSD